MGDTPIGAARYPNEHLTADMNAGIVYGVVLPVNSEISRDVGSAHDCDETGREELKAEPVSGPYEILVMVEKGGGPNLPLRVRNPPTARKHCAG